MTACKTQQVGAGTNVTYFETGGSWCPVMVLDQLRMLIGNKPMDSPLLPFPVAPLTTAQFASHCRTLWARLGLNPANWSGHSFRIGAASAASRQGIPAHIIRKLGRWNSGCYARYIPDPQVEMAQAFMHLTD